MTDETEGTRIADKHYHPREPSHRELAAAIDAAIDRERQRAEQAGESVVRPTLDEDPPPVLHGATCEKVPHDGDGYLHDEDSDSPYNVDNVWYCGRCHEALRRGGAR